MVVPCAKMEKEEEGGEIALERKLGVVFYVKFKDKKKAVISLACCVAHGKQIRGCCCIHVVLSVPDGQWLRCGILVG